VAAASSTRRLAAPAARSRQRSAGPGRRFDARQRTDATGRAGVEWLCEPWEMKMYIGGGILGTILLVLLIVWLARRV
jgi:hypothetical protein